MKSVLLAIVCLFAAAFLYCTTEAKGELGDVTPLARPGIVVGPLAYD